MQDLRVILPYFTTIFIFPKLNDCKQEFISSPLQYSILFKHKSREFNLVRIAECSFVGYAIYAVLYVINQCNAGRTEEFMAIRWFGCVTLQTL